MESASFIDGAAPSNHDWQNIADSSIIDSNGLCELYVSALEEVKYESAELVDSHLLADKLPPTLDPRSPKVRAILRDMKQLQESLPLHPDSAIFVRQVSGMLLDLSCPHTPLTHTHTHRMKIVWT